MNIFSFLVTAGKAQRSLAYLAYIHTLIDHAYEAHISNEGVHVLDKEEADITNSIMIKIKEHFEKNGWTYENLDRMAPQPMREAYNQNHIIIDKYFKEKNVYIPSYLALLMIFKIKSWKAVQEDITEPLVYFANKIPPFKGERRLYAQCVKELCIAHNINQDERGKKAQFNHSKRNKAKKEIFNYFRDKKCENQVQK